jgi:hypothetical protein
MCGNVIYGVTYPNRVARSATAPAPVRGTRLKKNVIYARDVIYAACRP